MCETIDFQTWPEFHSGVFNHLFKDTPVQCGRFLFRGHWDPEWGLTSAFDRVFPQVEGREREREELDQDLIERFREQCEDAKELEHILRDPMKTLALAQHHGLPTRLLDWSESPYVASFFAFEHIVQLRLSGKRNTCTPGNCIAIWALDSKHYIWSKSQGVQIISVSAWDSPRMHHQSGKFTLSRTPFEKLQDYVANCNRAEDALKCYRIPVHEAQHALADLDLMGINHRTMLSDLNGRAMSAILRVTLDAKARRANE